MLARRGLRDENGDCASNKALQNLANGVVGVLRRLEHGGAFVSDHRARRRASHPERAFGVALEVEKALKEDVRTLGVERDDLGE